MTGIQAAPGLGKTVLVRKLTQGQRAVYVGPLASLEHAATIQAFGGEGFSRSGIRRGWYDDPEHLPGTSAEEFRYHRRVCAAVDRLSTTYAGLQTGHLDERDFRHDTVILDEPLQTLTAALLGDIHAKDRREHFARFLRMVGSARRVILLDAHLEPWLVAVLADHAGIPRSQVTYIHNVYRPNRGVVHFHDSAASLISEAVRLWGGVRGLCMFTSIRAAEGLYRRMQDVQAWLHESRDELLLSTGEEVVIPELPVLVTSRTVERPEVRALLRDPGSTQAEWIIASPVITSGVSFDVLSSSEAHARGRSQGSPRFDHVFLMATRSGPGGLSMDDIAQMCARVRGEPVLHVYAPEIKPAVLSIEEVRDRWMHRAARAGAAVYLATPAGQGLRVAPDYTALVDLASRVEHRRLQQHSAGPALLSERLVEAGWRIGDPRVALPAERKFHKKANAKQAVVRLMEIMRAPPLAPPEGGGGTATAEQVAAAEIRKAIGYAPEQKFTPCDEALVRIHLARERDGGLPAYLSALAARATDGRLEALREDAARQGMSVGADGVAAPRLQRRYSIEGRARMERVEPMAPQDQVAAVRSFELRLGALKAGGIDVQAALGELTGVVVRPDQLDRVHQYLADHEHEVVQLGVVTAVAEKGAAARRKNAQTLLDWWGLQHERLRSGPAKGSWRISMPPRVRDALYYSGRGAPPPPVHRVEDPMVADVLALFESWTPYTLLTARDVLADVDRLGLVHLQAALTRPTELGRAKAMGMRLAEWAKSSPPVDGWVVVRKADTTSGRSLYAAERAGSSP